MKKGFTLVEVLAVIIILAIISLIIVPIVLDYVDSSRNEAEEESFSMYIKAVESAILSERLKGNILDGEYTINSKGDICKNNNCIKLNLDKKHPTSGTITIENEKIKSYNIDGRSG